MTTTTPSVLRADLLVSVTAEPIRELARQAEIATTGAVHFSYSTQPSTTIYYVFNRADMPRMTRAEAAEFLRRVITNPAAYTERWEPWTGYER